jgi:hypothetical protein
MDEDAARLFKMAASDSLNLGLVINDLADGPLKDKLAELGPIENYNLMSAHHDSLADRHQVLSEQLNAIESVLLDSDEERKTGLFGLVSELGDSVIVAHYDSIKVEFEQVESSLEQLRMRLRTIVGSYDRYFMALDIHDVLIKSIVLPPQIAGAIQNKLEQEQVAEEFTFRVIRERREAERKRVEAEGIRDFQTIIADGIDEDLLKWKGIEATLELAKSENAKVIIVGGGEDGLPLILNTE